MLSGLARALTLAPLMVVGLGSPAIASLGGPAIAEILGYNESEDRLYYVVFDYSEAGSPPQIFYHDLGSSDPSVPHLDLPSDLMRLRERERYAAMEARLDSLRAALDTLERVPRSEVSILSETLSQAYFGEVSAYNRRPVYVLKLEVQALGYRGTKYVAAFCNKDAEVTEVRRVPGHPFVIANLAYTGIPYESCYRRHELVLMWPEAAERP